jgi:hypothetical protein
LKRFDTGDESTVFSPAKISTRKVKVRRLRVQEMRFDERSRTASESEEEEAEATDEYSPSSLGGPWQNRLLPPLAHCALVHPDDLASFG